MRQLKIFNGNCPSNHVQYQKISFEVSSSIVKFTVVFKHVNNEVLERAIVFDLEQYAGKIVQLNLHSDTTPLNLQAITLLEYVDRSSQISTLSNNLENGRSIFGLCRLIFDEDILISFFDSVGDNIEVNGALMELMTVSPGNTITGELLTQSSVFAQQYESFMQKAKMISAIDHYNSIAYLECQIDVLTRIVKTIVPMLTVDISEELLDILDKADALSVINIKNKDKILAELDNKQYIRALQQEYYHEKSIN